MVLASVKSLVFSPPASFRTESATARLSWEHCSWSFASSSSPFSLSISPCCLSVRSCAEFRGGFSKPSPVGSCKCECARVVLETIWWGSRLLKELDSSNTRSEHPSEVNESHKPTYRG